MSALSDIDIRDWDRAEKIVSTLKVEGDEDYKHIDGILTWEQYSFLMDTILRAKAQYKKPKLPAILSWWRAV